MSYNYAAYSDDDTQTDSTDAPSGSGSRQDNINLAMVPHAAIEGTLTKVFGNQNANGQSIGIVMDDVELVDGCLYYDADKDKHKVFPWTDVVGMGPDHDDFEGNANKFLMKTYGSTEKRYELVESVVPEEDEPAPIGSVIMWYSGYKENGPKAASVTLAKVLTRQGRDMVLSKDDINNWLADTSNENVLRADLQDRRVAFFEVKKDSNTSDRKFHHPIVIDTETDATITVANGGGDGGAQSDEAAADGDESGDATDEADGTPEPISDFIATCESLGFDDRERAQTLLDDLVADEGNDLTADMVDEFGGTDAVLDAVAP